MKVIQGMQQEKIILPGHRPLECEARRKLLRWYESLSDEQKQTLLGHPEQRRDYGCNVNVLNAVRAFGQISTISRPHGT